MQGRRLAHFEVMELLGRGGMGEVYRARDQRLGREVALKLLPPDLAADPERLQRFRREAQTLASLNHPGIGAIYDLEEEGDVSFLVLELVEGLDLSERLARGPVPVNDALAVAVEMATALEVAHERGIVHRDLKPGNIKLGEGGHPKILDFGLAKVYADGMGSADGLSHSPTVPMETTQEGLIIGTAAYMAPEQARGEPADKRADIWAFGVVLFEMLTGRRLFEGGNVSEILLAVLSRDIDWSRLPPGLPPQVHRVLHRCLERDPSRRLRDIGEARIRLTAPEVTGPQKESNAAIRPFGRGIAAAVGVGLLAAVGAFFLGRTTGPESEGGPAAALTVDLDLEGLRLARRGDVVKLAPDGTAVLYPVRGGLAVRRFSELEPILLPGTEEARYAAWSPDSRQVAFYRQGRLWRVPVDGGASTDLGAWAGELVGSGDITWSSSGEILIAGSSDYGLAGFTAGGRDLGEVLAKGEGEADYHEISTLPDGRGFVFSVHGTEGIDSIQAFVEGRRIELLRLSGEALGSPYYVSTGHLVYERQTTNPGLWAVRFDSEAMEVEGEPFLVLPGASRPSVSAGGQLLFVRRGAQPAELVRVGHDGLIATLRELPASLPADSRGEFDLSPDQRRLAIPLEARPYADLWMVDLDRGGSNRLDVGWVGSVRPVWFQDSSRVLYASLRGSRTTWKGWIGWADGTREPRMVDFGGTDLVLPLGVSPDDQWLLYAPPEDSGRRILASRFDDPEESVVVDEHMGLASYDPTAEFSPRGDWLAYETSGSGRPEIWLQRFPSDGARWPVSTEGGWSPRWSNDDSTIYFRSGERIMAVTVLREPEPSVSVPREVLTLTGADDLSLGFEVLSNERGGDSFLMVRSRRSHRVTLITDLPSLIAEAEAVSRAE